MTDLRVIPQEVRDFFAKPAGRSLLVKGSPGTGKTTFALQSLEMLAEPDRSFYLSTRVSDDSLYRQFPWLKEKDMRSRIIDAGRVLLETLAKDDEGVQPYDQETAQRLSTAKDFLRAIGEDALAPPTKVDRTHLGVLIERIRMPEVERIYDRIETVLPQRAMLVVDSIEGITGKYGLDREELVFCLQKDLVEHSNTNILFVTESGQHDSVEYLVDGLITLSHEVINDKRVRHLDLTKLRATEIRQPSYLVTLRNGRFRSFEQFIPDHEKITKWIPYADTERHYSTGIPDLDALLGGGYARGSYNIIEIDSNVPNEEYQLVMRPLLLNFLMHRRGVVAVLNGGAHSQALRDDLVRFMPPEEFDKFVRVADYFITRSEVPYVMALGRRDEAIKIWKANLELLRGEENHPIMDFTGFDTLEYLQGGEVAIKQLLDAVSRIKISEDVGVGVLKPGLKLAQEIINMADTYLRLTDIDKRPCIYGVKPNTILYALVADEERGMPHVKMEPIV